MSLIKPIRMTAKTVTLSRADFDALVEVSWTFQLAAA